MEPWERALWEAHVGVWRSRYVLYDASGNILDRHEARSDIALDWVANQYAQRNIYTRNGAVEVRRYAGRFEGSRLLIEGEQLTGAAWPVDRRVILLHFRLKEGPTETFELITLGDPGRRARVMQHLVAGRMTGVTAVFDEERISSTPAIDARGNDLA
ncbi:MAG: hypothetical protein RMM58_04240 [Chloroflexota bacterium]|nr:hypothetical protein [Dehalococcoidia bacterium]MDW8253071.1 hypothetical protein [Chloroflexota bacterium]